MRNEVSNDDFLKNEIDWNHIYGFEMVKVTNAPCSELKVIDMTKEHLEWVSERGMLFLVRHPRIFKMLKWIIRKIYKERE